MSIKVGKDQTLPPGFYRSATDRIYKLQSCGNRNQYSFGTCAHCGQEILSRRPRQNWVKRYCSRKCVGLSHGKDGCVTPNGYRMFHGKMEHVRVAEKALGRPMGKDECVHHINMVKLDNRPQNLVICDKKFHMWIHQQMQRLYVKEHFGVPVEEQK